MTEAVTREIGSLRMAVGATEFLLRDRCSEPSF